MSKDREIGFTREDLGSILRGVKYPFAEAKRIMAVFAVHDTLTDEWQTAQQIADQIEADPADVSGTLHGSWQSDQPWVDGKEIDGVWHWRQTAEFKLSNTGIWSGDPIATERGRSDAASKLLRELDIEIPIEEISPALSVAERVGEIANRYALEEEILSIAKRKSVTWATAKGFNETYEQMKLAASRCKPGDLLKAEPMHQLMIYTGAAMHAAHCVVINSEQVIALPEWEDGSSFGDFMDGFRLPFQPLFVDFTGGDARKLVSMSTFLTPSKELGVMGALVDYAPGDDDVLIIIPIFLYQDEPSVPHAQPLVPLGIFAINQSDNPHAAIRFGPDVSYFKPGYSMKVLVSDSAALKRTDEETRAKMLDEYEQVIEAAAARVGSVFYMMESANVEIVEKSLERRDAKRAEKRKWPIPMTVRVQRPARRYKTSSNGTGESRDFSHQFEVGSHYKHVTKGSHVRCKSCLGEPLDGVGCSRCKGTGMDPEKVKPCKRIDVKTGELTCPNGCRREFVPTHVKGPEDKPLIPKVRVIK